MTDQITVVSLRAAQGQPGTRMPLEEALNTSFGYDACITCYDADTRQNKRRGDRSDCSWVIMDIDLKDNPGKADDRTVWQDAPELDELPLLLDDWRAWYATPNGYRVIYRLDRPVTPEEHEGLVQWFQQQYLAMAQGVDTYGFEVDRACSDWTRLSFTPFCMKPGWKASTEALTPLSKGAQFQDATVSVDAIPFTPEATIKPRIKVTAATAMPDLPAPLPEHVIAVGKALTGTKISLLGGGGMWEHLGQAISDQTALKPGGRDNAAAKGTGALANAGRRLGLSKEETFATAVEPFRQSEQLPPMEAGLLLKAWNFYAEYWENDEAVVEQALQAREDEAREGVEQMREESLVDKWKALNDVPESWGEDQMARRAVMQARGENNWLVLTPSGEYRWTSKLSGVTAAKAIEQLLPQAFKGWCSYTTREGEKRYLQPAEIHHPKGPAWVSAAAVGYICTGDRAMRVTLRKGQDAEWLKAIGAFTPVQPRRSEWIERYLTAAFGPEGRTSLEHYLSLFLAVQSHSIPALVITGPKRCGKSLICLALAGMFENNGRPESTLNPFVNISSKGDVREEWEDSLGRSPFQCNDDAILPSGNRGMMTLLGAVRQRTTQRAREINPKGGKRVQVYYYPRLAITSNFSQMAVKMLQVDGASSRAAIEATMSRLLPLSSSHDAAEMLESGPVQEHGMGWFFSEMQSHVAWLNTEEQRHAKAEANGSTYQPAGARQTIPTDWTELEAAGREETSQEVMPLLAQIAKSIMLLATRDEPTWTDLQRAEELTGTPLLVVGNSAGNKVYTTKQNLTLLAKRAGLTNKYEVKDAVEAVLDLVFWDVRSRVKGHVVNNMGRLVGDVLDTKAARLNVGAFLEAASDVCPPEVRKTLEAMNVVS